MSKFENFFEFLDSRGHSRTPGPADHRKNGSVAAQEAPIARIGPTTLDPWLDTNAMPRYRSEARSGNRAVAYGLIALAIAVYVGLSWLMGWGVFR